MVASVFFVGLDNALDCSCTDGEIWSKSNVGSVSISRDCYRSHCESENGDSVRASGSDIWRVES